jgi:hypothetical protein
MNIQLQPEFDDILQPLGNAAAEFFLAVSLYMPVKLALPVRHSWPVLILKALKAA